MFMFVKMSFKIKLQLHTDVINHVFSETPAGDVFTSGGLSASSVISCVSL